MIELKNFLEHEVFMRQLEINKILKDNVANLNVPIKQLNGEMYRIENLQAFFQAITELKKISILDEHIERILSIEIFQIFTTDNLTVNLGDAQAFSSLLEMLRVRSALLLEILDLQISESYENSFSILLPKLNGFAEYSKFFSDMDKIILSPAKDTSEIIDIVGFDTGSKWINILITSAFSVLVFKSIVSQAFDLYTKEYHQMKVMENVIKSFEVSLEAQEEFLKANKDSYNKALEEKTNKSFELIKERFPNNIRIESDIQINEYKNNLKFSIESLNHYIDKGMEVYKQIEEDKSENEIIFPDFRSKQKILELNRQRLITEK